MNIKQIIETDPTATVTYIDSFTAIVAIQTGNIWVDYTMQEGRDLMLMRWAGNLQDISSEDNPGRYCFYSDLALYLCLAEMQRAVTINELIYWKGLITNPKEINRLPAGREKSQLENAAYFYKVGLSLRSAIGFILQN